MAYTIGDPTDNLAEFVSNLAAVINPTVSHAATGGSWFNFIHPVAPVLPERHQAERKLGGGIEDIDSDLGSPRLLAILVASFELGSDGWAGCALAPNSTLVLW